MTFSTAGTRGMRHLAFDMTARADGILTLEAMAATREPAHVAVMGEVAEADFAWRIGAVCSHGWADCRRAGGKLDGRAMRFASTRDGGARFRAP